MILLKANDKLKLVFQKIIKTMGQNVEWTEVFIINNNDLILLGTLRSLFFNFDNKRVYSNIIDVTMNESSVEEMPDYEVLENALNMTLYTFGKWGGIKGLKVEKDYNQLNHLLEYILKEIKVEASLTKDNLRFFHKEIQITYEEVIQMILDKSKEDKESQKDDVEETSITEELEEGERLGLWHKMIWKSQKLSFVKEERKEEDKKRSRLGNQFYMVNYKCPTCGEKLYMAVYPRGEEFRIETDEKGVYLARAYTCSICNSFYTPKPKQLLAENDVYQLSFEDDKVAYEDYQELLGKQGQRASNSNFNEYEADYQKEKEQIEDSSTEEHIFDHIEAMTQEELNELLERLEAGFYSEQMTERYKELIEEELRKRKTKSFSDKEITKNENKETILNKAKENKESNWLQKEKSNPEKKNQSKVELTKEKQVTPDEQYKKESNVKTVPLSMELFEHIVNLLRQNKQEDFEKEIEILPEDQLWELKSKIESQDKIEQEQREISLKVINRQLDNIAEKQLQRKAETCKGKTYEQIKKVVQEIKMEKASQSVKVPILESLERLLHQAGKQELEQIIKQASTIASRKQYEQLKEKIESYGEDESRPYKKILEEKWDEAEQQEIASFMKRANPRTRASYLDTYDKLKEQNFKEQNVSSILEKLHRKVYDMDLSAINRICKEPAILSFEEGLEVYEQILLGEYLPEIKDDMLSQIEKRLTKLKTDECEQLVSKLTKEFSLSKSSIPRIYFYQARKMLRNNQDDVETVIIQNAIKSYANNKEKYEYPLLICDTSYAGNGESGFILTPNHIFYHSLLSHGKIDVMKIEEIFSKVGLLNKGIYIKTKSDSIKISNSLQMKDLNQFGKVLNRFVGYLKEKPESRNISYLSKEAHKVKCCYRCGFVYQDGNICPKCGSKMND